MKNLITTISLVSLFSSQTVAAQTMDSSFILTAFKRGYHTDPNTGGPLLDPVTGDTVFSLCGQSIWADTLAYFAMLSGCEANQYFGLAKYTYRNDTFRLEPFNYLLEEPFLHVYKKRSDKPQQTIRFLPADRKLPFNYGFDSIWMIKAIKGRKEKYYDRSSDLTLKLPRGKYDVIEMMRLSLIFRGPVVLFLDRHYDYLVIVNLPRAAFLHYYIRGSFSLGGNPFIKEGQLVADEWDEEGFEINSSLLPARKE